MGSSLWSPANEAAQHEFRSLQPVGRFARLSQPGDIDEGAFTLYDNFLSNGYRPDQELGAPGQDAPPQPLRRHPYGLALSADESRLYVTLEGNEAEPGSSVLVLDAANGAATGEIAVGSRPSVSRAHRAAGSSS